jgi:hypothetical protein
MDAAEAAEAMAAHAETATHMTPAPPRPSNLSRAQVLAHAASRLVDTMLLKERPILHIDFGLVRGCCCWFHVAPVQHVLSGWSTRMVDMLLRVPK